MSLEFISVACAIVTLAGSALAFAYKAGTAQGKLASRADEVERHEQEIRLLGTAIVALTKDISECKGQLLRINGGGHK